MKCHRFCVDFLQKENEFFVEDSAVIRQMLRVLKLKPKEEFELLDGLGRVIRLRIKTIKINGVCGEKISESFGDGERRQKSALALSILKGRNFDLAVEKAVELGVTIIQPMITDRTIKKDVNLSRLRRIVREAVEQSGRSVVPEILPPLELAKSFEKLTSLGFVAVALDFVQSAESVDLVEPSHSALFVGPEGGFSEAEREFFRANKFLFLNLGPSVLRAETAVIAGLAKILV